MSTINHASGGNFISNAEFLAWMQDKTDGIYGKMRDAMDVSNDRAEAEDALNKIKGAVADLQAGKTTGNEVYAMIDEAKKKYGEAFPAMNETLDPIAKELTDMGATLPGGPAPYIPAPPLKYLPHSNLESTAWTAWQKQWGQEAKAHPELVIGSAKVITSIDKAIADRWSDKIKNQVESFSKEDQLGLINIQEFNAQLNQAKQTASALMDAADKAANSIISHIS